MFVGQTKRDSAEDVGSQPLLSVLLIRGSSSRRREKVQDAALRPGWQKAEEVAEIGPGLKPVQLASRNEANEGGVHLVSVIVSDKEPILATDSRPNNAGACDGSPRVVQRPITMTAPSCCHRGHNHLIKLLEPGKEFHCQPLYVHHGSLRV